MDADRRGTASPGCPLLALVLAVAGCASLPDGSTFAEPGFADGEVAPGDHVWARLWPDDPEFIRHAGPSGAGAPPVVVEAVDGDRVRLRHGMEVRRSDVVVSARVKAGTLAHRPDDRWTGCPSVLPIQGFEGRGRHGDEVVFQCGGAERRVAASEVNLLERGWLSRQRQREWMTLALALLGFGLSRVRARAHRRAVRDADEALRAMNAAAAQPPEAGGPVGQRPLEVLRCAACGAAVPLEPRGTAACRHCGAATVMPPAYVELMRAREALAQALRRQVEALGAYRRARSPWWSLPLLGAGGALLLGAFGFETAAFVPGMLQCLSGAGGLGLLVAGLGQFTGTAALDGAVVGLAARPVEGGGHDCRACGAPLLDVADGAPVLCGYCGAQNLAPTEALRAARRDDSQVRAAGYSISALLADARLARLEATRAPALAVSWMALAIAFIGGIVLAVLRWG